MLLYPRLGRASLFRRACGAALLVVALGGCSVFDESLLAERSAVEVQAGNAAPSDASGGAMGDGRVPGDVTVRDAGAGAGSAGSAGATSDAGSKRDAGAMNDGGVRDAQAAKPDAMSGAGQAPMDSGTMRDAEAPLDSGGEDSGPPVCMPSAVTDYCAQLPELDADPVIDGVLDCGPVLRVLTPRGWNGARAIPTGHETKVAAAVTDDGVYFYAEVRGQTPAPHPAGSQIQCGDAFEVYVDADGALDADGRYSSPGTVQVIVAAPAPSAPGTIEASRFSEGNNQGAWSGGRVKTALLTNGYAVEGHLNAEDLGLSSWTVGSKVGIDFAVDVSAAGSDLRCGAQLGQYFMRVNASGSGDCDGYPWCDARAFCSAAVVR